RHRELDHQESYLRSTLNLMGITNVHILPTEGVDKTVPGRSLAEKNSLAQIPCMLAHAFNR
ncbi:FMN-dependent NADH-azoreductase, partial [Salmonella enterica]|nr:FMN-dependent NADH-azoreductase [Salmonella enterica]